MVAKFLTARPSSPLPPPPSSSTSPTVMSSVAASTLTQISIPPPNSAPGPPTPLNHNGHHSPFMPSRSPVHIGLESRGNSFHCGEPPSTPLGCVPPGVGIGGKFIFKSNVIQGPGEMPPGAPFLLMKPQGPMPPSSMNHPFPSAEHGRVVLVPGRHMPSSSPPNSQQHSQSSNGNVPGHSPQTSSHGHTVTSSAGGANGIPSSTVQNGAVGNGATGGRRPASGANGKAPPMTSREKKDLFTQRKQREFIPDNKKDDNYWDRRRRNNEAAKRSREKRRFNDMILEQRVIELTKENHILKAQLDAIKDKYNICGENLISLDQILNTMPTPDQVLNVNNAGHLTIASGLTTQHFRNFQLAREARADSVITGSPAKKLKTSPKSEDRSNSGGDDEDSNNHHNGGGSSSSSSTHNDMPQPDSQRRDHSPTDKDFYKRCASPTSTGNGVVRLVGASPLPPAMDKSPPTGLINYSLRDIYYNSNGNGSAFPPVGSEGVSALLPNRSLHHPQPPPPLPSSSSAGVAEDRHHVDRPESAFHPNFPYVPSSSGNVPVKYEESDDGHHCPSPPYRPHPAHVPIKMHQTGHGNSYFYDEQRRKRFEESPPEMHDDEHEVDHREQFMLLHRRQPEGTHLSQLELILNLSAKRDRENDQRSVGEPEVHCTDRDSPVLVAVKSHPNILPLKLRHKANVKQEHGGPELRRVQLLHGSDEGADDDVEHPLHHHHPNHMHQLHPHHMEHVPRFEANVSHSHAHHQMHMRHSPTEEHRPYPEDGRLVKTEDYDEDEEEMQHRQRIIEGGNARRVHCCIEVEKLSSPRPDDDPEEQRYRSTVEIGGPRVISPKPNNNILKTQLARLENEMATIKNMMYMNTNQATAAAQ